MRGQLPKFVMAGATAPSASNRKRNAGDGTFSIDDLIGGEISNPYNYGVRREVDRCASIAQVPCTPRSARIIAARGGPTKRLPSTVHLERFRDIVLTRSPRFFPRKCLRETGNSFTTTH